ncbi:hypothetical protein RF11_03899 [Thelohanellus kitauei]|uniref:Uncharacterized protein n=1 Tax=Thelohanellus kitauei TaxID=669202 RepID=A0A0C2MBV4_THEKT|nr:hypothetical protein RF11_03899 [Thelohanellus kitauei]
MEDDHKLTHVPGSLHFEDQFSILSDCAISQNLEIAVPLKKFKILLITLSDDYFVEECSAIPKFRILDVEPPKLNESPIPIPNKCGNRNCSQHRGLFCEKAEYIQRMILSNRLGQEPSLSILSLDFSPSTNDKSSYKLVYTRYLLVVTVRGDCLVYLLNNRSFLKVLDIKEFLDNSLDAIVQKYEIELQKGLLLTMVTHAKWLPIIGENCQFITLVYKIFQEQNISIHMLVRVGDSDVPPSIVHMYRLSPTTQPSLFNSCSFGVENISLSLSVLVFGGRSIHLILFNDQITAFHEIEIDKYPIDTSISTPTSNSFILIVFYSHEISFSTFEFSSDSFCIQCTETTTFSSKSSSEIIGGFFYANHIYYGTKSGYVFDLDIITKSYNFIRLPQFKVNRIVSHFLWRNPLPIALVLHTFGSSKAFSGEDSVIEFVAFGSPYQYLQNFICQYRNDCVIQKICVPVMLKSLNYKKVYELISDYATLKSDDPECLELINIFTWRSIYLVSINIIKFLGRNQQSITDLLDVAISNLQYYLIYYRNLLLLYSQNNISESGTEFLNNTCQLVLNSFKFINTGSLLLNNHFELITYTIVLLDLEFFNTVIS